MLFSPQLFGEGSHQFVQQESHLFGFLSPIFHILSFVLLLLTFLLKNKIRRIFIIYFMLNWVFLIAYWGIYSIIYWFHIGPINLFIYIFVPILLSLITIKRIKERIHPQVDLDLQSVSAYRFIISFILMWGFWYPSYVFRHGFIFAPSDLLSSKFWINALSHNHVCSLPINTKLSKNKQNTISISDKPSMLSLSERLPSSLDGYPIFRLLY